MYAGYGIVMFENEIFQYNYYRFYHAEHVVRILKISALSVLRELPFIFI